MKKINNQIHNQIWSRIRGNAKRLITSLTEWQVDQTVYHQVECNVADQIEDLIYAPVCLQIREEAEHKTEGTD
jgi:hypothetical protein